MVAAITERDRSGCKTTLARSDVMKGMKLAMITLACAFALSSTAALATTIHRKPTVRAYAWQAVPLVGSRTLHPSYGNPDGTVSAGGYLWNGRSASEWGGD
jgi:hypothetical protein